MTLLFLNNVGTVEVIFIMFIVLMFFGSKSIPGLARTLGKGMREIRNASSEIRRDIQNSALEMRKDLNTDQVLQDEEISKTLKEIEEYKIDSPDKEMPKEKRGEA